MSFSHVETGEKPHKRHMISHSQTSCFNLHSKECKIRANLMKQKTVDKAVEDKKDQEPELWVQECVIISLREQNLVQRLPEL